MEISSLQGNMPAKIDDPRLYTPQCLSLTPVKDLHVNRWFVVRDRGGYFTVEHKHRQVIILPVVDDSSILIVRVKRPVIADITWELPAGSVKENEKPIAGAARELAEETGIKIQDIERFLALPPISNSPNRNPNLVNIYEISLSQTEYDSRNKHDDEVERVECYGFNEIKEMLISGQIYVGMPVAIIGRYLLQKGVN